MNFRKPSLGLSCVKIASLAVLLAFVLPAQQQGPMALEDVTALLNQSEADKPSEEVIEVVKSRTVLFPLTKETEQALQATARKFERQEDLTRRVLEAIRDNYTITRLKTLFPRRDSHDRLFEWLQTGLKVPHSEAMERELIAAGADDAQLSLLWAPEPPQLVRGLAKEWRTAPVVVSNPPRYNAQAVRGTMELDLTVDGRVLVLLKGASLFYFVICGRNLEVRDIRYTAPLPRLPLDEWDYRLEPGPVKNRGKVFLCPADPRCRGNNPDKKVAETHCRWDDLDTEVDPFGYGNARFAIEDDAKGAAPYKLTLRWALRPYNEAQIFLELAKYGPAKMKERLYNRGVGFRPTEEQLARWKTQGVPQLLIDEIRNDFRGSNWQ